MLGTVAADALAAVLVFQPRREPGLGLQRHPFHRRTQAAHVHMWRRLTIFRAPEPELELHVVDGPEARRAFQPAHAIVLAPAELELGSTALQRSGIIDRHRTLGERRAGRKREQPGQHRQPHARFPVLHQSTPKKGR